MFGKHPFFCYASPPAFANRACACCSIQALLSAPNPDDPLADNVAKHWKDNEPDAIMTGMLNGLTFDGILLSTLASHCPPDL